MSFAVVATPLLIAMGASLDFVRAYNIRNKMQTDLDAAILSAIKEIDNVTEQAVRDKVKQWFAAQTELENSSYFLADTSVLVNKVNHTIHAELTVSVPTTLLRVAHVEAVDVKVSTKVVAPSAAYLNIYMVLDKSASMMLAATTAGQTKMKTYAGGCVFACHTAEGDPKTYNSVKYYNNYDLAKALSVDLRADISVKAAEKVLDMVAKTDPTGARIKVSFYTMGSTATSVLDPTSSISTARQVLKDDAKGLTSKTSFAGTYFHDSLPALTKGVGAGGDGSTAAKPLKLVLMLTDGAQSDRNWVHNEKELVTPLNPAWCKPMKDAGVTVGVLYTEYLPITGDWGYERTLGDTMKSSWYKSAWKGVMPATSTIKRRDYIPTALSSCASSSGLYLSAASSTDIEQGLSSLLEQYLSMVRLTQ